MQQQNGRGGGGACLPVEDLDSIDISRVVRGHRCLVFRCSATRRAGGPDGQGRSRVRLARSRATSKSEPWRRAALEVRFCWSVAVVVAGDAGAVAADVGGAPLAA